MAKEKVGETIETATGTFDERKSEVIGLMLITVSLLILSSALIPDKGTGYYGYTYSLVAWLKNATGVGVYLLSLIFWIWGVEKFRGRAIVTSRSEWIGYLLIIASIIPLAEINSGSGGYIGRLVLPLIWSLFGEIGALFVLFALFLTGISLSFHVLFKPVLAWIFEITARVFSKIVAFALSAAPRTGGRLKKFLERLFQRPDDETYVDDEIIISSSEFEEATRVSCNQLEEEKFSIRGDGSIRLVEQEPVEEKSDFDEAEKDLTGKAAKGRKKSKNEIKIVSGQGNSENAPAGAFSSSSAGFEKTQTAAVESEGLRYRLPPVDLLREPEPPVTGDDEELKAMAEKLVGVLASFNLQSKVVQITRGPSVIRFELQPARGVKVSKILALSDDIALGLAAQSIRIEAPIPGKAAIGIEMPNPNRQTVYFSELIRSSEFKRKSSPLLIALGKTINGAPIVADLRAMPHLLIAGATGSGKSVCINTVIASILFNTTPDEVRFIMIDPKRVELSIYNHIPALLHPVITEPADANAALLWAVREMERRYQLLSSVGIKNIESYNEWVRQQNLLIDLPADEEEEAPKEEQENEERDDVRFEKLPYIVVIIDELADLMMTDKSTRVEESICRLAQMARAIGIHLVVATQRPSVNVITGLIKANLPSRIAFAVSSQTDSRTILDMKGAEKLIGKGDMLYSPVGIPKPMRLQGALVTDEEINRLVDFLRAQGPPQYVKDIAEVIENVTKEENNPKVDEAIDQAILEDAMRLVVENRMGSTSMLQRLLKIGHNRAMKIMATLEQIGVVGPFEDKKPRKVNWNTSDLEKYLSRSRRAAE